MERNNEISILSTRELEFSKVEDEILTSLRKLLLPYSDKEAGNKLEGFLTNSQEMSFHVSRACEMICELTHCAANQRQVRYVNNMSSHSQELNLLMHLFDYFGSSSGNMTKQAVFFTLFNAEYSKRWPILAKLVSMAISVNNADILEVTSSMASQLSGSSEFCSLIVDRIVYDFIFLYPDNIGKLKELPLSVPIFCIIFMKTVTGMYGQTDVKSQWTNVPNILLEVLVEWIERYNSQLIVPFHQKLSMLMNSTLTPYPGILKWMILSSLYEENKKSQQLFVKLHNAVCGSLVELRDDSNRIMISAETFISIIQRIEHSLALGTSDDKLDDCLIRLAQIIQVSVHSKAIYGDIRNLEKQLDQLLELKSNRLLDIVVTCLKNEH